MVAMSEPDPSVEEAGDDGSFRRRLLKWLGGLGVVGFLAGLLTPLKDLALAVEADREGARPELAGQRLVYAHSHEHEPSGHVHEEGMTVKPDHLAVPDAALAFPAELTGQDEFPILLHRLEPDRIAEPTNEEWTDRGFVAYSAICTHLGCNVSWTEEDHEVGGPHDHCPCHVGEFDPYRGAEVVGGPPPRPLPQIGVTVEDEQLVLTSEFDAPIGGETS